MNRRERARLGVELVAQGATVRSTKAGYLAKNPATGGTVSWHSSPTSDSKSGEKNLIMNCRAAGFVWPFGTEQKRSKAA